MNLLRDFTLFQLRELIKGTVHFFIGEGEGGNLSVHNYFYAPFLSEFLPMNTPQRKKHHG